LTKLTPVALMLFKGSAARVGRVISNPSIFMVLELFFY
jgi:hypothetical protein